MRFVAHPIHGDLVAKKDIESIQQHMRLICMIEPGELPYAMGLGVGVRALLFTNYTDHIRRTINAIIKSNLDQFVKRATIHRVENEFIMGTNELHISIEWSPKNEDRIYEYDLILRKVR